MKNLLVVYKSISIKYKFWLTQAIFLIGLISIIIFYKYSQNKITGILHFKDKVAAVYTGQEQLQANEMNFLFSHDDKYVAKFDSTYESITSELHQLKRVGDMRNLNLHTLDSLLIKYNTQFMALVGIREEIGLTENKGLRGKLRNAIHNVEYMANSLNSTLISRNMLLLRRREKDFIIRRNLEYVKKFEKDFKAHIDVIQNARFLSPDDREKMLNLSNEYRTGFLNLVRLEEKSGLKLNKGISGNIIQMRRIFRKTSQEILRESETAASGLIEFYDSVFMIAVAIISLIFSMSIYLLIGDITGSMLNVSKQVNEIGNDLKNRINIDRNDEIGKLAGYFNQFIERINSLLIKLQQNSVVMEEQSKELDSSSQMIKKNYSKSMLEVNQVSSSMSQMVASINEIATLSGTARERVSDSKRSVINETRNLKELVETSANIKGDLLTFIKKDIVELQDNAEKIDEISIFIQDISDRTNLLSLNTAIEAANAGEAGKGFQVIAGEIRDLSDKTTNSARHISTLTNNMKMTSGKAARGFNELLEYINTMTHKLTQSSE